MFIHVLASAGSGPEIIASTIAVPQNANAAVLAA